MSVISGGMPPSHDEIEERWPLGVEVDVSDIDPTRPTAAKPATFEKLRVMHARRLVSLPLFHPDDAPGDEDSNGLEFVRPRSVDRIFRRTLPVRRLPR